jgi:hypothetical protein
MKTTFLALFLTTCAGSLLAQEFQFDTSRIATPPKAALPQERMTLKAFEGSTALRTLPDNEKVDKSERLGASRIAEFTTNWRIERDPMEGALLLARQLDITRLDGTTDESKLRESSVALLGRIGVPRAEIGRVMTRSLVASDADGEQKEPGPAKLILYKTFVIREINGVPVEGHRAVVSHTPSGALHRANLLWPAIAGQGHKLESRLTVPQITARATQVLMRNGEKLGKVSLRWKYVPVKQASGEVALRLVVGARIQSAPGTEPREITVPVD